MHRLRLLVVPQQNTENYAHTDDNPVKRVAEAPVSTFAIDVDTGSYANVRALPDERPEAAGRRRAGRGDAQLLQPMTIKARATRACPFRADADVMTTPWNPDT